jgi:5-methylcytosine-specific restriction protein A
VLERYGYRCHWSRRPIRPGDNWDLDHVKALINGGENRENNLAPILRGKEHKEKTAADVAIKSRAAKSRKSGMGITKRAKIHRKGHRKIQSRGFEYQRKGGVAVWKR